MGPVAGSPHTTHPGLAPEVLVCVTHCHGHHVTLVVTSGRSSPTHPPTMAPQRASRCHVSHAVAASPYMMSHEVTAGTSCHPMAPTNRWPLGVQKKHPCPHSKVCGGAKHPCPALNTTHHQEAGDAWSRGHALECMTAAPPVCHRRSEASLSECCHPPTANNQLPCQPAKTAQA